MESESLALARELDGADLVTSELALTEVPRAVRRAAAGASDAVLNDLLLRGFDTLETISLVPLEHEVLVAAGALGESRLRSLDAIHVASAATAAPIDAFVTYDARQAEAARKEGFHVIAP